MPPIIQITPKGLYCEAGDFFVDPWGATPRAIITHAHSDHARIGSKKYLATANSVPIIKSRLGSTTDVEGLPYGKAIQMGGARVSLHPAGHILGSAQVRIEVAGEVWVVTGDYKRELDPTCASFEVVPCHCLITESTFGLPIFRWPRPQQLTEQINTWWRNNRELGNACVIFGYALGKSQRVLSMLDPSIGPIYLHGALARPNEIYREQGIQLPPAQLVSQMPRDTDWAGAMILAVPSAHGSPWTRRFGNKVTAMASGWMQIRGNRRRKAIDQGFVLSDHVDWQGLITTIEQSGAEQVWVTHGYTEILSRYLAEQGYDSNVIHTEFVGEVDDAAETDPETGTSTEVTG